MPGLEWDGRAMGEDVRRRVVEALDAGGRLVAARARDKAPRDSGELAALIHHEVDPDRLRLRVIADAPHAVNVEFDTSDTNAQPFLRPALFESEGEIIANLKRILK